MKSQRTKDMRKNIKIMGYGLLVMVVIFVTMPLTAQNAQQWQSASSMQESGSRYSSKVTPVGATGVGAMSSTTSSFAPAQAPSRPRRAGESSSDPWGNNQDGGETDPGSPIGDAVLPLMLMALAFGGVVALRRRKTT